jgi:hypothetical protein
MMREKYVVKADFSALIIMCFERLGEGEDNLPLVGLYVCEKLRLSHFLDK